MRACHEQGTGPADQDAMRSASSARGSGFPKKCEHLRQAESYSEHTQ